MRMNLLGDDNEHRPNVLRLVPPSRRRNTELARRRRHVRLMREFACDLGLERPTAAERALLEQAATMTLRSEQLRDSIGRGEAIAGDEIVRLSGHLRRLFAGLQRAKPDDGQSLAAYLAENYGGQERAPADRGRANGRKRRTRTSDGPGDGGEALP
jgi:hypothetical protein